MGTWTGCEAEDSGEIWETGKSGESGEGRETRKDEGKKIGAHTSHGV